MTVLSILFNPTTVFLYLTLELFFSLVYHLYCIPKANAFKPTVEEYRDYGNDRHKLVLRILRRIERTCKDAGRPVVPAMNEFLRDWFCRVEDAEGGGGDAESMGSTSASSSSTASGVVNKSSSTPPLRRGDTDNFFAWAFFGKDHPALLPWEQNELQRIYSILDKHGLKFDQPGCTPGLRPMRLTLDDINATYRPLLVYFVFSALNLFGRLFLWACGFRRHRSRSGLTYWHRPRSEFPPLPGDAGERTLPLLFFHGIAPGGLALYLPMILWGFGQDRRAMFLFENTPISFSPCFDAVDEVAFVSGVMEAMERHLSRNMRSNGVALLGHSFGSCQLAWLLRSPDTRRVIRQVVLMDPVTILLSEPDVMTNFLYKRESLVSMFHAVRPILLFPIFYLIDLLRPPSANGASTQMSSSSFFRSSSSCLTDRPPIEKGRYNKIWMVQSELFIEHYLRRNFWWFNSELWLEDIPDDVKVVVCVSGKDEILNPRKIRREVLAQRDAIVAKGRPPSDLELIYWADAGHAYLVPRPWTWKQVRAAMRRQEMAALKEAAM